RVAGCRHALDLERPEFSGLCDTTDITSSSSVAPDVAEWMGRNNIDITFKIYRHLMPRSIGTAADLLETGLAR
ncbi:hypothetical protein ACFWFZ_11255, partial [Streptomyces sp. NPDC060232]